jgi:hypothetical protein
MIALISDGLFALLVTGAGFAVVAGVSLVQLIRPARLRSWRDHREVKRRVITELERRQAKQLDLMRNTVGASHREAFLRYLVLQNSIETAKRM